MNNNLVAFTIKCGLTNQVSKSYWNKTAKEEDNFPIICFQSLPSFAADGQSVLEEIGEAVRWEGRTVGGEERVVLC